MASQTPTGLDLHPTLAELQTLQEQGLLKSAAHPSLPLRIYNYTQRTEYKHRWTPLLECCRGLVLDIQSHEVVARPMRKFGNHGDWLTRRRFPEMFTDPPGPPAASRGRLSVSDKLDGSLMIIFHYQGHWIVASRGQFDSPHARSGTKLARESGMVNVDGSSDVLEPGWTYLFELLSPDHIVRIDYGDRRELVLLATIHTKTGVEKLDLKSVAASIRVQTPDEVPPEAIEKLLQHDIDRHEGYVLRWDDGSRMKIKFKSYWALVHVNNSHAIKQLRWRVVEELCKTGSVDKILDDIDDEQYHRIREFETTYQPAIVAYIERLSRYSREMIKKDVKLKDVQVELQDQPQSFDDNASIPSVNSGVVCSILNRRQRHVAGGGIADDAWLEQAVRNVAFTAFSKTLPMWPESKAPR